MEKIYNYAFVSQPNLKLDTYKLIKHSKITRFIIRLLIKFKVIKNLESTTYARQEIKYNTFIELIRKQMDNIRWHENKEPSKIILGYDAMRELQLENNYILYLNDYNTQTIFGMEIILNPYIDGIVII